MADAPGSAGLQVPSLPRVYRRLVGAQVRAHASYRTSFALDLAGNALIPAIDILTVLALFRVTPTLGGFTPAQVLVMFGLSGTSFALADLAVGNIERIRIYVRMGRLDTVLVRPRSVLGQLLAEDFTVRRVARLAVAVFVLGLATVWAGVDWTPARAALIVLGPLCGAALFGAIFVASATVAFWWIDSGEFANGFTYGGRDFTTYPVNLYGSFFRRLFAYGLGFAFVAYFPALALFGRADPLGFPGWFAWCSPAVSLVAICAAALWWRIGVRHYRSTGS